MEVGRKRLRSDERTVRQQKYFVTDRLIEKNDKVLMDQIYKKTLSLMFAGARGQKKDTESNKHENSLESEENDDDDKIQDTVEDKLPTNSLGCKLCLNDISCVENKICSNCSLKVCKRCALDNCTYCSAVLCVNCINIFGCSVESDGVVTPICEECKSLI